MLPGAAQGTCEEPFRGIQKGLSKKFSMFSMRPKRRLATFVIYILRGSKLAYKYAIFTFVWAREGTVKGEEGWGWVQTQVVHFSCNAKQLNNAPNMMNYSRQKTCRKLTERGGEVGRPFERLKSRRSREGWVSSSSAAAEDVTETAATASSLPGSHLACNGRRRAKRRRE